MPKSFIIFKKQYVSMVKLIKRKVVLSAIMNTSSYGVTLINYSLNRSDQIRDIKL